MPPPTAIALSGGVDSLVAAHLLRRSGVELVAVHFRTGFEAPAEEDRRLAGLRRRARCMGLPLHVIDCAAAFRRAVVDDFVCQYRRGRTPNPCVRCNRWIKFGALLGHARTLGAERLATGHYARLEHDPDGSPRLYRGHDTAKEQSYFLARLRPAQLSRAVFPLGTWTKDRVRALAATIGLDLPESAESQDVCFIGPDGYPAFLAAEGRVPPSPGPIVDVHGRRIGTHDGLHRYTVGQRRGIDCPAPAPYYVVRLDTEANRLVVGTRTDLLAAGCRVAGVNWLRPPPSGEQRVDVRLRYRSPARPSRVVPEADGRAAVRFDEPLSAVTPGQCAVFYVENEVIGSGWIEAAL